MTDVAYLCHYCGSVHEVESIRQNLILDLRTAASYELYGQHRILSLRARFLRWRMTRDLALALWPRYQRRQLSLRSPDKTMIGRSEAASPHAADDRASRPAGPLEPGSSVIGFCVAREMPSTDSARS